MTKYHAVLLHGARGGEGNYEFEGPDDLMRRSPVKVMRAFMEHLDQTADLGHLDYLINAAMKNSEKQVVTVLGEIDFSDTNAQPFVCMISPA
ncbi:MAG: hypothetical protein OIF47_17815 [Marinibacterium sp.]|nr:hypothetical protein [Marinibacterium sp.]